MAWFDDLDLPGSTVTGHFGFVHEDGPDEDTNPDIRLASGRVTFTPTATAVRAEGAWIGIAPIEAVIFEGSIVSSEESPTPPRILSTDADTGVEEWAWRASFEIPGVKFQPLTFKAPTTGVHLTSGLIPIKSAPYQVVQGRQGVQGASIVDVEQETPDAMRVRIEDPATGEEKTSTIALPPGPQGPYGGTNVTDPQLKQLVSTETQTRTVLDARYRRSVSVAEYGAAGDGQMDDTTAVQAALTGNPGVNVYFPPGHYRLTGNLAVPAGTTVSGADSASTLLDWSGKGSFGGFLLEWGKGALTDSVPLTADTAFGDGTVTVETGHGFAVGDYVRITADEVLYGEMVKGEFQRVLDVDGETLELSSPMFDSYTTALSGRVEKAHLVTGGLRGVTVRGQGVNPDGYGDAVARFALARDVQVSDVRFEDVEHKCIQLDSVLGAVITDCHFRFDTSRTPLQYGVAIQGASQMVTVSDCSSWNDRHMVTTATSQSLAEHSTENRGIPRIITITGCTAHGSWQAPIDTHRGGEYVTVTGCALTTESTGIKFRGKQSIAVGNTIVGKQASITGAPYGVRIGMLCEDVQITGNLIRGFEDGVRIDTPDGATRGIVVSGNSILDCARPVGIHGANVVSGVRIAGNLLRANPGGYAVYVIAAVDGLEAIGNTMVGGAAAFYMAHGTRPINRLVVQSNTARGQTASYGMFFRNVYDGLVTSNFSPAKDIRFSAECLRVVTGLNQAPITDLSTPGVDQR